MGNLGFHLAAAFERSSPSDWRCSGEKPMFDARLAQRYGFNPQADAVLVAADGRRIAVEFEISRADPVANQVKFLVARNAGALHPGDVLVSMFSSHIARGRRNLAAAFARQLRTEGLPTFSVSLLPRVSPTEIQRLNSASPTALDDARLPIRDELDRIFSIVEPRGEREHRIHFAGDVTDVVANVWAWNDEVAGLARDEWGHRRVQFFVHDPASNLFAPSKFCAFVPVARPGGTAAPATMTLAIYTSLGEQDPRFDGNRARVHLEKRLAFDLVRADRDAPSDLMAPFEEWLRLNENRVAPRQPVHILRPPAWYAQ